MEKFLEQYQKEITGVISVHDRIIFKGYLPISYPRAAEGFMFRNGYLIKDFRNLTSTYTEEIKRHAEKLAADSNRPYEYQRNKIRKEGYAHVIVQRDNITNGLVCVIARNEQNHSFGPRYGKGRPVLIKNSLRCIFTTWILILVSCTFDSVPGCLFLFRYV